MLVAGDWACGVGPGTRRSRARLRRKLSWFGVGTRIWLGGTGLLPSSGTSDYGALDDVGVAECRLRRHGRKSLLGLGLR